MSGLFGTPGGRGLTTAATTVPEPVEDIRVVGETAEMARRRERKKLLTGGRQATIISGIMSALKKRLGE